MRKQGSGSKEAMNVINKLYSYLLNDTSRAAIEKDNAAKRRDYRTVGYYSGMYTECMVLFDRLNELRKELEEGHL